MSASGLLTLGTLTQFPSSLVISTSVIVNSILADTPFFTNGLFGLAVLAFFIILRRGSKFIYLITGATFVAFVASLMDLSQLLTRGNFAVQTGTNINQVLALLVAREVGLSIFPGLFFLFFWFYVALPPRGELEKPYGGRSYSYDMGIIHYPEAYHSARWDRWGRIGEVIQWLLLGAVIAVPVLQAVWRLSAFAIVFGPVYNASATLEIILASVFALKMLGNVWLSSLPPRWRIVRDYLPALIPLTISLVVSIMNTVIFKFAETPLGRLMQASQCYILLLYMLIATFYGEVSAARANNRPSSIASIEDARPASLFRERTPAQPVANGAQNGNGARSKPNSRNSRNTLSRLSTWLMRGRSPFGGRNASTPSNLENGGREPSDEKQEPKYMDSYYFNEAPFQLAPGTTAAQRDAAVGVAVEAPSPTEDGRMVTLAQAFRQEDALTQNTTSAYGLNGVIGDTRYVSGRSSQSSNLSALLRQQAELDKSVAGLQMYSSAMGGRPGLSPTQSDFSLSKFPEPPFALSGDRTSDGSGRSGLSAVNTVGGNDRFTIDNMEFALVPPRMPAASTSNDRAREPSGVSTSTFSSYNIDSDVPGAAGRTNRFDSVGTQYDVTSFIGGLTAPAPAQLPLPPVAGTTALTPILSESEGSTSPRSPTVRAPIQPLVTRTGLKTITPAPSLLPIARRNAPQKRPVLNLPISAPKVRQISLQPAEFERPRAPPSTTTTLPKAI